MTFVSRSRSVAARAFAPATILLVASFFVLVAAGCDNKHIGRLCDLNVNDPGTTTSGNTATINPQALECPSRICLSPGMDKPTDTVALCTAECESDEDCSDGEGGPRDNSTDHHCETGFACVVPTTVGDFCCRRMCACKDFLNIDPRIGYKAPAVCLNGGAASCR